MKSHELTRTHFSSLKCLAGLCVCWLISAGLGRAATPVLPSINTNNIINAAASPYNAVADGATDNTTAIQAAIIAAAHGPATNSLSGGTVRLPGPGTYLCGPLALTNKINLEIDGGATLKFLPFSSYPNSSGSPDYPLAATNKSDIEISGAGTIDGNGLGWWSANPPNRPYMIYFGGCQRVLIQNVTLQNPPKMHLVFKNSAQNITIQNITINTPPLGNSPTNAPNTDGIDLIGTTCVVQNSTIIAGDDNIALGSSSAVATDILITNCTFGAGHGVSIGGNTEGGVSNLTVINCTFSGTDYGIRMKSDNASSGGNGQGGLAQNLAYYNLGMTNIAKGAIVIYSYYNEVGTPTGITPDTAASEPIPGPVPATTCKWRNITISNLTATVASNGIAGIIWGRTETPVTNLIMTQVNITAPTTFDIYNATGVQFIDSQITAPGGIPAFTLYNTQLTVSNTLPSAHLVTFDGQTSNSVPSSLSLFNAQASFKNTNIFDAGSLTLGSTTLTVSNSLNLSNLAALNYVRIGSNAATLAVFGNLTSGGTVNVTNSSGFGPGTYTLMTYTGSNNGPLPTLGSAVAGFGFSFTNTPGQIKLIVIAPTPAAPTNLMATPANLAVNLIWSAATNATSYNLKRSNTNGGPYSLVMNLPGTNYSDTALTNGVTYYYVVSALDFAGESTNSAQASAVPLPSAAPPTLITQFTGGKLKLSWPADHLGWHLQEQANATGLGANWTNVPGSFTTNQMSFPIDATAGSVFLRLVYP